MTEQPPTEIPGRTYWELVFTQFRKNKLAILAGVAVLLLFTVAIFAPFLASGYPLYAHCTRPVTYQSNLDGWEVSHGELAGFLRRGQQELASNTLPACRGTLRELESQLPETVSPLVAELNRQYEQIAAASPDEKLLDQMSATGEKASVAFQLDAIQLVPADYYPLIRKLSGWDLYFMSLYLLVAVYFLLLRKRIDRIFDRWAVDPFNAFFIRLGLIFAPPLLVALLWVWSNPSHNDIEPYQQHALQSAEGERFIFSPIPYSPDKSAVKVSASVPPSWAADSQQDEGDIAPHLLGTDGRGYDVAASMIWGSRVSLSVGFVSVSIYVLIGVLLGAMSGYFMGWFDILVSRVIEVVICFPFLFLIIIIMAFLPPSIYTVMLVIGVTGWPGVARLVRAEFIRLSGQEFVLAAQALGISAPRIIFRHILPNAMAPVLVLAAFGIAGAILTESALSFLGIGIPPDTPSWGSLLNSAQSDPRGKWWLTIFSGLAVFVAVTAYNLLAEGVRDAIDPRLKE